MAMESEEFVEIAEPFRRELLAHCYRMLGSFQDAEDMVQETLARAWRSFEDFEGRSSVRTWLYRIATNRCLTELENRNRRVLPSGISVAEANPDAVLDAAGPEVEWVQPAPDQALGLEAGDPASVVSQRESLRLAVIVSFQHLPPKQRVVLILRDVLQFSTDEVAAVLDTSTESVKSALQRARARMDDLELSDSVVAEPSIARARELLDRYVKAFNEADIAALEELLVADVALEATPYRTWFAGRQTCVPFLRDHLLGVPGDWRLVSTGANGQPAAAVYARDEDGCYQPYGICVLTVSDEGVTRITSFGSPELLAVFGFAPDAP